jgi:poly-gamma-glutamate synthesis protein (capsule biosynthesis protein)
MRRLGAFLTGGVLVLSACSAPTEVVDGVTEVQAGQSAQRATDGTDDDEQTGGAATPGEAPPEDSEVTLAFAGDVHFEGALAALPDRPRSTMGEMSQVLRDADLAMVNLESPVTTRGSLASKELEVATNRFWFRSAPAALDVLDRSGVDVVSVANNHGGDYGVTGLKDTLRAAADGPVDVVGIGRGHVEAYTPYRQSIDGTDVAVLAADASFRESVDDIWSVRPGSGPGIASARVPYVDQLTAAVGEAAAVDDVVVVYLHWGDEGASCPTPDQGVLARALADAGADVVVGAHTHTPVGSGLLGDTYVNYGLGNFLWYNGSQSETGVLELTLRGGEVVGDRWAPATIPSLGGAPVPLRGAAAAQAVEEWRSLRSCTDLDPGPSVQPARAAFDSTIGMIGSDLRERMVGSSHDPATCPVPLSDLRRLTMSYVGFDGSTRTGVMVVHAEVAREVVGVFETLYEAGFRIERMQVVDAYGGDDNASMAANNTSGYNCRTVAGTSTFSDHAFGKAIDINPVQNPYVIGDQVLPPAGRRFVDVDRAPGVDRLRGVIAEDGLVTRAFERIGWSWGGDFSDPDYQHFSTS